jgi:hypothetical protein
MIQCGHRSLPPSNFLLLEDQQFGILGDVMALRSEAYDSYRATSSSPYRIHSRVSTSSLTTFLSWCHDIQQPHPISVTSDNVFDLAALADEFQIQPLRDSISSFLESSSRSLLIPSICYRIDRGDDTAEQETGLARDILGFIDDDSLLSLPLSLLKRVVVFPDHSQFEADETVARAAFDRIFEFCVRLLDRKGSSASVLFAGMDLQLVSAGQLAVLHRRGDFIWAFVGESAGATVMTAVSVSGEDQRRFQAVQSELVGLRADHAALMETCDRQRESIDRLSAAISRFKAETRDIASQISSANLRFFRQRLLQITTPSSIGIHAGPGDG